MNKLTKIGEAKPSAADADVAFLRTAVIIPCYNEGKAIAKVVRDFRRVMPSAVV